MAKPQTLNIALWSADMGLSPASLPDWVDTARGLLQKAAAQDADIFIMPEYICEQWMSFAPAMPESREIKWMAGQAAAALPSLQQAVKETGVALLAGSMPAQVAGGFVNRSTLLFPDRAPVIHDKLVMTPFEKEPAAWNLEAGKALNIFEWRGTRAAMLICLDVEMPALCSLLAKQDIDLLLVPSMTAKLSGFHRVSGCAKARAVELMAAVATVGSSGSAIQDGIIREGQTGGAALYLPCEEMFGSTGVHAELPPKTSRPNGGEVLYAKNVPVGQIRALRQGKPEVWPGPWRADGVTVVDETAKKAAPIKPSGPAPV